MLIKALMRHAVHDYYATLAAECQDDVFPSLIDPKKAAEFPSLAKWLLDNSHTEDEIWEHMPSIGMEVGLDEPDWL